MRSSWSVWLQANPTERQRMEGARAILMGIQSEPTLQFPDQPTKDTDFATLMKRTRNAEKPGRRSVRRSWTRISAIAASLLLLLAAGFLLWPSDAVQYATGDGEMMEVNLPDGTTVTLNANSTLSLPQGGLGGEARVVDLVGEAYFAVAKQTGATFPQPFLVRTNDAVVRVLGTRFNVRDRRGSTRIFLEEGAVSVDWTGTDLPETKLLPGELVDYPARGKQPVHRPAFSAERHIAWKSGNLIFDRLLLAEALNEIGDLYGIELRCANAAMEQRELTSAGVPVDNLALALQLLEKALDLRIEEQKSGNYVVYSVD
jgi:ferric-dicitrate binding protein FerR (iron transport regulator)